MRQALKVIGVSSHIAKVGKRSTYKDRFRPAIKKALEEYVSEEQDAGGTQTTLAEKSGLHAGTFSQQLNGNRTPTLETLDKVSSALGKSVFDVLGKLNRIVKDWDEMKRRPDPVVLAPRLSPAEQFKLTKLANEGHQTEEEDRPADAPPSTTQAQGRQPLKPSGGKRGR